MNDQQMTHLLNRRIEKLEEDILWVFLCDYFTFIYSFRNQKKEIHKLEDELKDVRDHFAAQLEENRVLKAQLKNEQTVGVRYFNWILLEIRARCWLAETSTLL